MSGRLDVSRRVFLKAGAAVGGGLMLGIALPRRIGAQPAAGPKYPPEAFLRIAPDDTVTVIAGKAEMGQGVYTALAMLVCEELECDWSKVRVESAPVAAVYNHTSFGMQMTGGSTSTSSSWDQMRTIGATAREMLIAAAAERWGVDQATCRARDSVVTHAPTGRMLRYGALADAAAKRQAPTSVRLKDEREFRLIGKPTRRLDTPEKLDGRAEFGIDVKRPGMLTALVARPPVFGGRLRRVATERALGIRGVKAVVEVPSGVAVIADGFWPARKGRAALDLEWEDGDGRSISSPALREQFAALAKTPGLVAKKEGPNIDEALARATKVLEAEYEVPYLAHAMMEPLNAVVELRADGCELWTGTQFQTADREAAAKAAGLKPDQVQIHTTLLGGGFGRRANPMSDWIVEAVEVAKHAKAPVKVIWTREDDIKGGYYRPSWYDRISGGLDESGNPVAWRHTLVGQSILAGTPFEAMLVKDGIDGTSVEGARDLPYAIPSLQVELHSPRVGIPVLWWRSVGHSHTAFVTECFLDELARAAGRDPVAYRRALLRSHPRHLGVLELTAQKAGWDKPLAAGRARGVAVHESFGSFVAQVAEVSISDGAVKVHRVVCAIDCGRALNPNTIAAQMESGIGYGLSAALHGAITFKDGRVEQANFHDYRVLRMHEMPEVETHIVPSSEKPGGAGEPATPPIAPAVCNALFALTGRPIRRLPIRHEDLVA
jgi:isoquinoline 1-oxidoreductase beta subunit